MLERLTNAGVVLSEERVAKQTLFIKGPIRFLHLGLVVSWLSPRFVLLAVVSPYSFACTPVIWQGPKIKRESRKGIS